MGQSPKKPFTISIGSIVAKGGLGAAIVLAGTSIACSSQDVSVNPAPDTAGWNVNPAFDFGNPTDAGADAASADMGSSSDADVADATAADAAATADAADAADAAD